MLKILIFVFVTFYIYVYVVLSQNFDCKPVIRQNLKKKIALCISGQIRKEWEITLGSIKKYIIDALDVDVFFEFNHIKDGKLKNKIIQLLQPKDYAFQDVKIEQNYNAYSKNFGMMMTRMINCNNMKKNEERRTGIKYDIVIRIRPDMFIKQSIPANIMLNIEQNTIYSYEFKYLLTVNFLGITDQFFVSNSVTMDKIMNNEVIDEMNNIKYCKYNEYALYRYVSKSGINIKYFYASSILYKYINTNLVALLFSFIKEKGVVFFTKHTCQILNK